jgi:MraZ protein
VDTKGRVSIPAPYRRVLEAGDPDWEPGKAPRVAIAHGDPSNKRFECFPIVEIERLARVIKRMPQGDHREALQELYSSQVTDTTLDDNGRVVLSQAHRDKFGIKGEARFVSALEKFEIWSPDIYAEEEARVEELFDELGDEDPLSLLDAFDEDVETGGTA